MAALADPEIQKAFMDLRSKGEELQKVKYMITMAEKNQKTANLNKSLISEFGDATRMYSSVGRMFLLTWLGWDLNFSKNLRKKFLRAIMWCHFFKTRVFSSPSLSPTTKQEIVSSLEKNVTENETKAKKLADQGKVIEKEMADKKKEVDEMIRSVKK